MASSFTINLADLTKILAQIKIAEQNAGNQDLNPGAVNIAGQNLVDIIGQDAALLPLGLRTVSGVYNHLLPGTELAGSADQPFPRLLPQELRTGVAATGFPVPGDAIYDTFGNVVDTQPRTISNLIVDQSTNNPAAVEAWFANPLSAGLFELAHPGMTPIRPGQTAGTGELAINNTDLSLIANQSPDIGLSPQFNGFMTFFGQFFDHGLDLVPKGGNGNVFIPLLPDDPLYSTAPGAPNFMVISRLLPNAINITTPFVDQNQTYTSHPSHQVFLREYKMVDGVPIATGHLLSGAHGGMPTWAEVKAQAASMLGIQLVDADILKVPLLATDDYGRFIRGAHGFAQVVLSDGTLLEGNPAANGGHGVPIPHQSVPAVVGEVFAVPAGTAFLDDIAHDAAPNAGLAADADNLVGLSLDGQAPRTYDNELLDMHLITGDGRGNENVGLTTIHTVFHNEHDRLVEVYKGTILASGNLATINEWLDPHHQMPHIPTAAEAAGLIWNGERLFQAGRFVTEMQYQHLVFEEFARKVQPNVDPFVFTNSADLNPAIVAEFAHTVYRFGHSMLTDTVDRLDPSLHVIDGNANVPGDQQIGLIEAFLNPVAFLTNGTGVNAGTEADVAFHTVDASVAAGAILRGVTRQAGNEIDEFVVNALRNNLVGLPLDLAAINMARGRDAGIPTLNHAREELYGMTGDAQLKPYTSWVDFAQNLKHPESIINFMAAYGTHASITSEASLAGKRAAAMAIVFGSDQIVPENVAMGVTAHTIHAPGDALDFINATGLYTADGTGPHDDSLGGLNNVDLWIGGLAEELFQFGGMLGSTFGAIFEYQMEHLQNGDRFYYLSRTQGMNLINQLEPDTFADLVTRNTDLGALHSTHISGAAFGTADLILELDPLVAQNNPGLGAADPHHDTTTLAGKLLQVLDPIVERVNGTIDIDGNGFADGNLLKYSGAAHVVLGGTEGNDRLLGDKGIDTLWGDGGNDYLNAGMESDQVFGGEGDDIIEDPFGDNFLRGNQGNDVISAGHGINLLFGDTGKDFLTNTTDPTEFFAGEGNDFILAGSAADVIGGNEGDDWIEGGEGFDDIGGDNSELFFNSPIVGHDVMDGQGNDTDYDGETGDDIMVQGPGIQRNNGMDGFDWAIHLRNPNGADSDLGIRAFDTRAALILRDRFDSVEGLSGWKHDDILTGASKLILGENFNSDLTQAGVNRINGLRAIIGNPANTSNPDDVVLANTPFTGNEIILGGAGNDTIRGNLGNDILDGDAWLNVRLDVYSNRDRGTVGDHVVTTVDTLSTHISAGAGVPAGWAGKSLAELMIAGTINPGQLEIVREVLNSDGSKVGGTLHSTNSATDVDVAVFSDVLANYTVETNASGVIGDGNGDGFITVAHTPPGGGGGGGVADDGTDQIRNFEVLQFADQRIILNGIVNSPATGLLAILDSGTPGISVGETLTVQQGTVADTNGVPALNTFTFAWQFEATPGAGDWQPVTDPATGNDVFGQSFVPTVAHALEGLRLRVIGTFRDGAGLPEVVLSSPTSEIAPAVVTPATAGPDTIFGTLGADVINALAGDDTVFALAGNDIVNGGPGSDLLDGGAGSDTVVFDSTLASATFGASQAGNLTVTIGADTDEVINFESLQFTDQTILTGIANTAAGLIRGTASGDTLTGTAAAETFVGLGGNDTIIANGGDDVIVWNAGDGLDTVDGGAHTVADTLFINGIAGLSETFRIYTSAAWTALLGAGHSVTAGTEIVITRNGTTDADRIVLLDNVEELQINARPITGATVARGDTVQIFGDFSTTSLALNTITINGGAGDDTVDITGLTSSHRIVFRAHGGNDTIVGDLRPQDVIELPAGSDLASFDTISNADGSKTLSNGADTIHFTGSTPHVVVTGTGTGTGTGGNGTGNGNDGAGDDNTGTGSGNGGAGNDNTGTGNGNGGSGNGGSGNDDNTGQDDDTAHCGGGTSDGGTGGGASGGGSSGGTGGSTSTPSSFVVQLGTPDNDTFVGTAGGDTLTGQAGDDTLLGLAGDDNLVGGAGADNLVGDAGRDIIFGNDGDDIILAGVDDDQVFGGKGNDTIFGDDGNDNIFGNEGRDIIDGGLGRDVIFITVNDGDDVISGGGGIDTLDMSALTTDAVVDLGTSGIGFAESVGSGHDTLDSIENVKGGAGNDTIYASNSVNTLDGGSGHDVFVFRTAAAANGDTIEGFQPGDKIDLSPILGINSILLPEDATFSMAGQFRMHVVGGDTIIEGNTDISNDIDFTIKVAGKILTGSDFS